MITIKSEMRVVSFEYENEIFKSKGEARITDDKAIKQVNGTLYKGDKGDKGDKYAGSFSSDNSVEGKELKFNINSIVSEDLAQAAELVNNISAELKAKYSV